MAGLLRIFTKRIVIICNLAVSASMLLLYLLRTLPLGIAWAVNLLALVFPFLLLLQVCFLFFWIIVKRKLVFIPIITLLLSWNLITKFVGLHKPEKNGTQKKNNSFRVVTWNTHLFNFFENNGNIDNPMLQEASEYKADVFFAQEFVYSLDKTSPIALDKIKQKLGYKYVVTAYDRAFGVHTNIQKNNERYHPFCVAIFSNYPIIRWKKEQSLKEYNHTFLWADILINSDTFRFFNIHLQSLHFAKKDYEFIENIDSKDMNDVQTEGKNILLKIKTANILRYMQASDVKESINRSPYPVIVCGDMNDVPNSNAYQIISHNLHDAFIERGWGIGRTFKFLSPTLRIDYVLYSKPLSLQQVRVIKNSRSDHSPILADFNLP